MLRTLPNSGALIKEIMTELGSRVKNTRVNDLVLLLAGSYNLTVEEVEVVMRVVSRRNKTYFGSEEDLPDMCFLLDKRKIAPTAPRTKNF